MAGKPALIMKVHLLKTMRSQRPLPRSVGMAELWWD